MQTLKLVQTPYPLYTGSNGKRTYGIKVESVRTKEECEDAGYKRQFNINEYTFLLHQKEYVKETLGIDDMKYDQIVSEFMKLCDPEYLEKVSDELEASGRKRLSNALIEKK